MATRRTDLPFTHPAVDKQSIRSIKFRAGRQMAALVTCANCRRKRWRGLSALRDEMQSANFRGWCKRCSRRDGRCALKLGFSTTHPAVDTSVVKRMRIYGHRGPCVRVRCPVCNADKWLAARVLKHAIARPNFTGICRPCWLALPKARTFRTNRNPSGRTLTPAGYVSLGKNAISDADLDLFVKMRGKGGSVTEHRWVMAKHLDRALTSYELVDHMNGNKTDNSIENLRLYIRGKQQPGSAPGHGTYYHEWQMAEQKIRDLQAINRSVAP